MMSSMASIASSSSATVRVEKATSEFLIGPDWTMNIDICDTTNSNQMLAKDIVKAVKKRLQHKNPKVQLLALTLLETMVKNCGDYVHMQIAERNILQEMVKIVKKKTDMHVRDKILTLIGSWYEAFGGSGGRYPQYYMAYEDLRHVGVEFPRRSPDAAPIFTPPATHPTSRLPQPGYGIPSSSSTRLDEAMAAEENLSPSSVDSMREVLALLIDMLQAIDSNDRTSVKDEVIVDLVEQCRANQKKLMQMLSTTGDEELLGQGLELNDNLQNTLAKHDAVASGSPLPVQVTNVQPGEAGKPNSSLQPAEVEIAKDTANTDPSVPVVPVHRELTEEEEEEEDEFALLARRHSKNPVTASNSMPDVKVEGLRLVKTMQDAASPESPLSSSMSSALVPITTTTPVQTKDRDIIDLLSITLSTEQLSQTQTSPVHSTPEGHMTSVSPRVAFSSEAYPGHPGLAFNNYVAPWAHPRPQHGSHPQPEQQPLQQPLSSLRTPQYPQYAPTVYPPPPWASTPGYFSNPNPGPRLPNTYETPRPTSSTPRPLLQESSTGNTITNYSPRSVAPNAGQKPFIPSYRLFEDLDVFGSTDGGFKATSHSSPSLSGSNNHSMVGGRK